MILVECKWHRMVEQNSEKKKRKMMMKQFRRKNNVDRIEHNVSLEKSNLFMDQIEINSSVLAYRTIIRTNYARPVCNFGKSKISHIHAYSTGFIVKKYN